MELFEIIFKIVHVTLCTAGLSFNGLLIMLSIFKTPKAIKSYSILILNHAMSDTIGCLADFYIQLRLIPTDWTLAYVVNGYCQYISVWSCTINVGILLTSYNHSLYVLLICFLYRYLILIRKVPSVKILLLIVFVALIPSAIEGLCLIVDSAPSPVIEAIVKKRHPYYTFKENQLFGGYVSLFNPITAFGVWHSTMSPTPIYVGILILRRKIIEVLDKSASHLREQTKEMHRQLLKALTIQAVIPVCYTYGITSFLIGQLDIYHHPYLEYSDMTVIQIAPVITPLVSLYYIRPYREAISKFFGKTILRKGSIFYRKKSSVNAETTYNGSEQLPSTTG